MVQSCIFSLFPQNQPKCATYCWWKKSCTSWYGKYLIIYQVFFYIPGGAGFLPSTFGPQAVAPHMMLHQELDCCMKGCTSSTLLQGWHLARAKMGGMKPQEKISLQVFKILMKANTHHHKSITCPVAMRLWSGCEVCHVAICCYMLLL